ncbi:NAD(P)/FAD-dependent oxidoreductase [Xanthovirga aplysinae]|uniref:NAD(P)/FAD-dependent oxidoreductase n=1 Tax=Xanthovirga aplysinae TaxID=2529853 RepID=UPI0012BC520D|nr:FAD-dependent oxidoreductase [Xanthovirga aplysinae]MTI32759.1 FAD-binding protein [Xanthovirga aplysinae]
MIKELDITVSPEVAFNEEMLEERIQKSIRASKDEKVSIRLLRRSIDARSSKVKVNVKAAAYIQETPPPLISHYLDYPNVADKPQAIVVGAGPAGLFAALRLIELGVKPIVLERGKDVKSRRRDLAAINKDQIVNPESNYCFGEGGAGTYSDGKLYTRSKKRGDLKRILEILVAHGATDKILVDAHPHIGTNKLPKIVEALRESIRDAGGEVHFNEKVTDFILENGEMKGVKTASGETIKGLGVILATGHSARDIFELLHKRNIAIEAKPFALGVRIEHAQNLIDRIQYKCRDSRGDFLPAASYSLVHQVNANGKNRGVFSFCMCPGGFIVPAATAPGEVVVNGMSPSRRDSKYSNSGIVVAVDEEDFAAYRQFGPLSGMYFQQAIEQKACEIAGNSQMAPAQRMVDFVNRKVSSSLLETSYQPGLKSVDMWEVLPKPIAQSLRKGFIAFGKKMRGYLTNDAQIIGVESRTSSPVRIPRDKINLEHTQVKRFYPCAEGAGYAGGIVSAAMDGERCAEQLAACYVSNAVRK